MSGCSSYESLKSRLGEDSLRQRLLMQANHWAEKTHQGEGIFKLEKFISVDHLAEFFLKATGLWKRAHANIFKIETIEIDWDLPRLPDKFDGFRLLQISDPHIDIDPELSPCLASRVQSIPHDALVVTGDYRNCTVRDHGPAIRGMQPVINSSHPTRFGILGNHDFLEMVDPLEKMGLRILLNEAAPITRDDQEIWIAGTDDPHFYMNHDFARARSAVPDGAFCILLCHSPEVHAEAAEYDFDLILSGHTHAGQICLPGGRHIVCPVGHLAKSFIRGRWKSGNVPGYTSRGSGCCGVAARLNCMPEITLHILRNHAS